MFGGINICEVAPGTVIEHEGEKLEVTDGQAVRCGRTVYVTPRAYARLKSHPEVRIES